MTVEAFSLDQIIDAVIILEISAELRIRLVNSAFETALLVKREELILNNSFPFFAENVCNNFLHLVQECSITGNRIDDHPFPVIKWHSPEKKTCTRSDCFVTMVPHHKQHNGETNFVTCIFREYTGSLTERLLGLELMEKYSLSRATCFEYDEAQNDLFLIYASVTSGQSRGWGPVTAGRYVVRDLKTSQTEADNYIEIAKKIKDSYEIYRTEIDSITCKPTDPPMYDDAGNLLTKPVPITGLSTFQFIGYGPSGRPRYFFTIVDVTHIKNMEKELAKKKEELEVVEKQCNIMRKFFDSAPVMMGVIHEIDKDDEHPDFVHTFINPASATQLGSNQATLLSNKVSTVLSVKSTQLWRKKLYEARRLGHPVQFEKEIDATKKHFSFFVSHVSGDEYIYVGQDITQRTMLEAELQKSKEELESMVKARTSQLEEALQVKSRFLAIMSHEMRTPLTGITAMISLLSDAPNLYPEQKELLNIAHVCSDQLLVAVTDILDLTQMEESRLSLDKVPFCLERIMEESLSVISADAEKKGLELAWHADKNAINDILIGDPRRIRQIFINLMANSVKFSEVGGIILSATLKSVSPDGKKTILFSVADSGIGIPEAAKQRLFEPFYQVDSASTRKYSGNGLGLSISKRLAELMGGTMYFESCEGVGTTIYFSIQVDSHKRENSTLCSAKLRDSLKILLIHSYSKVAEVICSQVESVLETRPDIIAHKEAMQFLDKAAMNYDLIVLNRNDKQLQELNITKSIVARGNLPPIIVLSFANSCKEQIGSTFSILHKPLRTSKLIDCLSRMFPEKITKPSVPLMDAPSGLAPLRPSLSLQPLQLDSPEDVPSSSAPDDFLVLVAEDNAINQRVIKRLLEKINIKQVDIVEDGVKAVEACNKKKYGLVLMDIMMPRMNGLEASKTIKTQIAKKFQPNCIIALTANALQDNREKCLEAGMADVLTKPIDKEELQSKIAKQFPSLSL